MRPRRLPDLPAVPRRPAAVAAAFSASRLGGSAIDVARAAAVFATSGRAAAAGALVGFGLTPAVLALPGRASPQLSLGAGRRAIACASAVAGAFAEPRPTASTFTPKLRRSGIGGGPCAAPAAARICRQWTTLRVRRKCSTNGNKKAEPKL